MKRTAVRVISLIIFAACMIVLVSCVGGYDSDSEILSRVESPKMLGVILGNDEGYLFPADFDKIAYTGVYAKKYRDNYKNKRYNDVYGAQIVIFDGDYRSEITMKKGDYPYDVYYNGYYEKVKNNPLDFYDELMAGELIETKYYPVIDGCVHRGSFSAKCIIQEFLYGGIFYHIETRIPYTESELQNSPEDSEVSPTVINLGKLYARNFVASLKPLSAITR